MVTSSSNIVSCNISPLPSKSHSSLSKSSFSPSKSHSSLSTSSSSSFSPSNSPIFKPISSPTFFKLFLNHKKGHLQLRRSSPNTQTPQDPPLISSSEEDKQLPGNGDDGGGEERDWTTSFLLFAFWAGLMYYVSFLAPNQTPVYIILLFLLQPFVISILNCLLLIRFLGFKQINV